MANSDVIIDELDDVFIQVQSPNFGIVHELDDFFTFMVKGAEFSPRFRHKMWDGKFRLYQRQTGRLYKGLYGEVIEFCKDRGYTYQSNLPEDTNNLDIIEFENKLKLNKKFKLIDYQKRVIKDGIDNKRLTILSPTSSGKTLIFYSIIRWLFDNTEGKILMVVPSVMLVTQAVKDFAEYSTEFDVSGNCHIIYEGQDKTTEKRIIISTYQSIYNLEKEYFDQFDAVLVDEVHGADAKSIKGIMEKCTDVEYKIGCTATLKDSKCHQLVIKGLFGDIVRTTTSRELMDRGIVAELLIKAIVLEYDQETRDSMVNVGKKKIKYIDEMDFIVRHDKRNRFIGSLASNSPNENTLVLSSFHDDKPHLDLIKEYIDDDRKVYIINGLIPMKERERIKKEFSEQDGAIMLATYGCLSTGVSINNIQRIINATNNKSFVQIMQTIGRGLRLDGKSNKITVYDIADDFSNSTRECFLMGHFIERLKLYTAEKYKYTVSKIQI